MEMQKKIFFSFILIITLSVIAAELPRSQAPVASNTIRVEVYRSPEASTAILVEEGLTSSSDIENFDPTPIIERLEAGRTYYVDIYRGSDLIASRTPFARPMDVLGLDIGKTGEYVRMAADSLEMAGKKITGLPAPTENSDAATKGYVDTNSGDSGNYKSIGGSGTKLFRNY